jgi:hypothetical protein
MIPGYTSFEADIKKLKFENTRGSIFSKTAIVTFHLAKRTQPLIELLGYVGEEDIYRMIDKGEPVVLDECYIPRFSLENYRHSRNLDKKTPVVIKGFLARNSFFDSSLPFDFSHAVFDSGDLDLQASWVHRGAWNFDSARFNCELVSFYGVRFADDAFDFKNVVLDHAELNFRNSRFGKGHKDFHYSEFGSGKADFANVEFSDGDVSFVNTDFGSGEVNYKLTRFGTGRVDFHYAKFRHGDICFERTDFGDGRTDFRTVEFGSGRVTFNRAQFGDGEVSFEASEMASGKFSFKRVGFGNGTISFEEAVFRGIDVSFERTDFGRGNISFYKAVFNDLSFRFCHLDHYCDLRLLECRHLDLSNTIVRDIIDLNPHEFHMQVETIDFAGMRLIGRIYLDWKESNVIRLIQHQKHSNERLKAEQYRTLKENFNSCGQYNDEDHAYVEFKRHEAKADLADAISKERINAFWAYPFHWFKLLLFDRAGLYATSPLRVLTTMLAIFVIFSLVYILMITTSAADIISSVDDSLSVVSRSFYHSAITFLTIGYGDHFPYKGIRWVSSLEGFSGLFLMSYFTVAFVRKILR